jgi:hypothetical protein
VLLFWITRIVPESSVCCALRTTDLPEITAAHKEGGMEEKSEGELYRKLPHTGVDGCAADLAECC